MNARVKVFQLIERGLRTGHFSHVFRAAVEISADLFDGDCAIVEDGDLFGSGEDEIFGDLYSELCECKCTPEMPWMKTRMAMSLPCASCP